MKDEIDFYLLSNNKRSLKSNLNTYICFKFGNLVFGCNFVFFFLFYSLVLLCKSELN